MWILRRLSIASTENVYGAYSGNMEFHSRLSLSFSFYNNFKCRVGNSESSFDVKTGVRQGCPMSALLFNLAIDWVMRKTTSDRVRGIRWTLLSTLEDLDFADDLALLSHTHQHMQEKTTRLGMFAQQVGLKISRKKTEVMMLNVSNPSPVKVNGEDLQKTEEFTYFVSTVRHDGGAGSDIRNRLSKARNAFRMLNNVWISSQYQPRSQGLFLGLGTRGRDPGNKVVPVQHRDQAKTVLELRTFNLAVRLRMLEDDCKRPQPTVHLPHQEPSKNPTNILAQDHLQPTSFRPLQPRQHEHHHHANAMEMDRECDEKRARQHLPHSPSLDTGGEAETGATEEHLASNCRRGA